MDKNMIKALIKAHQDLENMYRDAAGSCMNTESSDPYLVYTLIKDSMTQGTKVRHLKNRFSHVLEGK
jgi:hypothetical protein